MRNWREVIIMKCILCGEHESLSDSIVCVYCASKQHGNSLTRFAKIRRVLDSVGYDWTSTAEIARATGIPKNTVVKYLRFLLNHGLVEKRMVLRLNSRFTKWCAIWRKKVDR